MRVLRRVGVAAAALSLLTAGDLLAQTTGRIVGTIIDTTGAPVPGVVVTVTSPSLQGAQSATTTSTGEFRLLALPPGTYELKTELQGFQSIDQKGIAVGIDRTVTLPLKLAVAGVTESIQVNGESPVVDTTSATTGITANAELFERIPLQRTFDDVARVAPGTQRDNVGMVVYGSSGAENQYVIDGLNTTGIRFGDLMQNLNFDFVDQVEVKTGGMPAEYGRMTGGSLNVLTKSGGNQFTGDAFGFFEGKGLAANNTSAADRPAWQTQVNKIDQKYDFGASLGGYVVKDKLWFFGAYNRINQTNSSTVIQPIAAPGSPAVGSVIPTDITTDTFAGKLTWKVSPNHTLTASVFGDPNTTNGVIFSTPGTANTSISGATNTWNGTLDQGATDYVARYDGVFSNTFMIRAQYGRHKDKSIPGGPGRDTAQLIDATVTPNALTGGFGFFSDENYTRDQARLDLTKFLGNHEVKVGGDWQGVNDDVLNYQGGAGQRIYELTTGPGGTIFYRTATT